MHKVMVVTTRNSIYVVTQKDGVDLVEVDCKVGTFAGESLTITRRGLGMSTIQVGEPMVLLDHDGRQKIKTSKVEDIAEFYAQTYAERTEARRQRQGFVYDDAPAFVRAVVGHVQEQINPVVRFVD